MARRTVDVAVIMNEDLRGCSLADVLEKLEKGKIGHRAAMEWLAIDSFDDLVGIMRVPPETRELVRRIFRPAPRQ